jgi:hypothetical protein
MEHRGHCRSRTDCRVKWVLSLLTFTIICLWMSPAGGDYFYVLNTADAGPGTLRQAILDANAHAGADVVVFAIGAVGSQQAIWPNSALPAITDTLDVHGWSQGGPGYNGPPLIELNGQNAGASGVDGLELAAPNSVVRGLAINRFSQHGIVVHTYGNCRIYGNYIGTNLAGSTDAGNGGDGVRLYYVDDNTIGGTTASYRNVISGNDGDGVAIHGYYTATFNKLHGNYIGTDATGTSAIGNGDGVYISGAPNNLIGGTNPGEGNVISGNWDDGIEIAGTGAADNLIRGNYIGTNAAGTAAVPNNYGVYLTGAINTVVGGSSTGSRNIISGNAYRGVLIAGSSAAGNRLYGNYIGTDVAGTGPLGNGDGVWIASSASYNDIGGSSPGMPNRIAHNGRYGICVQSGVANTFSQNTIYSNGDLGIDLNFDGVTPNDYQDPDTGPNNLQNRPILTSVVVSGGNTTVQGTLNSTPDRDFALEFFENYTPDPSGYGEGASYFGTTSVHTDASTGNVSFSVSFPGISIPDGHYVSATATDQTTGDTSEFSQVESVVNNDIVLTASLSAGSVVLNWTTATGAVEYWVYAAMNYTYFPPLIQYRQAVLGSGTTTWSSSAGVGNSTQNYTYMVLAVDGGGSEIARSNRAGEFDFSSATMR